MSSPYPPASSLSFTHQNQNHKNLKTKSTSTPFAYEPSTKFIDRMETIQNLAKFDVDLGMRYIPMNPILSPELRNTGARHYHMFQTDQAGNYLQLNEINGKKNEI
jgi:hypothetical protein